MYLRMKEVYKKEKEGNKMNKKLDKEFKRDVDNEFREGDYVCRKIGVRVFVTVAIVAVLGGLGGVAYTKTIKKAQVNVEREVFKESVAYTEQAASFLAKSYKEYNSAEADEDKKAIMEYVVMRYPNLDTDSIDNSTLKQFYIKCLNN